MSAAPGVWQALHFADPSELVALAVEAEALGFTGVALGDHLLVPDEWTSPYPYTRDGRVNMPKDADFPDPWVSFAAVAARTERLRFTTWVFVLPLREVFSVAKAVATLDRLAPGRTVFGVGVGWLEEEFRAAGIDFTGRGRRTDEMLEAMRLLWTGQPVSFHGDHVAFDAARLRPVPAGPVPITIGGHTPAALRRAADHDGWYALAVDRAALHAQLDELAERRRAAGRADRPFTITAMVGPDADPADCADLAARGVTDVCCPPPIGQADLAAKIEALRATAARLALEPTV
jgi:probable F420-dependent oxidoreductase